MKVQDLARDDDFLSHLLVEKLGTGGIPLLVHKMDPSRRLPKTNPQDLMAIIRRVRFIVLSPYRWRPYLSSSRKLTRFPPLDSSFQPKVPLSLLSMMVSTAFSSASSRVFLPPSLLKLSPSRKI
jgi:hypothetical protein